MFSRVAPTVAVVFGLAVAAGAARANPRPLPMTYQSESLPQGAGEIEQFVDFVPTRAQTPADSAPVWFLASQFQTEVEYGLTSRLELAIYFTFVPSYDRFVNTPVMPEAERHEAAAPLPLRRSGGLAGRRRASTERSPKTSGRSSSRRS